MESANEKRKWYSMKRFLTKAASTGSEVCLFSANEEDNRKYNRSEDLHKLNRTAGLTKAERDELVKLLKWFKSTGEEYRFFHGK